MLFARSHLLPLVNQLHDLGETTIPVKHPSDDIGELLRIELDQTADATIHLTSNRYDYEDNRDDIQRKYGKSAYEDLPDPQNYVRTLIAGGYADVANRDDIKQFLRHHGHPDIEAGHDPVMAGLDTNLFPFYMPAVLQLDTESDRYEWSTERPPVTGFVLASGVKEELDWHYKHYETRELTQAFGEVFERLSNQPAGENRQGVLGLYQFRTLMAERQTDFVESGTGDADIIDSYVRYMDEHRKEALLFSNDTGFVDRAIDAGVKAQKVAFPAELPEQVTLPWPCLCNLLYILAVTFGVIVLPKATLYGAWNGKDGAHWKDEELVINPRSDHLGSRFELDKKLLDTYD